MRQKHVRTRSVRSSSVANISHVVEQVGNVRKVVVVGEVIVIVRGEDEEEASSRARAPPKNPIVLLPYRT